MYRVIKDIPTDQPVGNNYGDVSPDERLFFGDYKNYLDEARVERNNYNSELAALMNQYGIRTEIEAITGDILELHWFFAKKHNYWSIKQSLNYAISSIIHTQHDNFWDEFLTELQPPKSPQELQETKHRVLSKAAAYYFVTYQEKQEDQTDYVFLSFPWMTVSKLLCVIKAGQIESFNVHDALPFNKKNSYKK